MVFPVPAPSARSEPRCRQTLTKARIPFLAADDEHGTSPAHAPKRSPTLSTRAAWPTYCQVCRKIRSCSRRRISGSEYQLQGSVLRRGHAPNLSRRAYNDVQGGRRLPQAYDLGRETFRLHPLRASSGA